MTVSHNKHTHASRQKLKSSEKQHFEHDFPFKTAQLTADVNEALLTLRFFQIRSVPIKHVETIYSVLMAGLKSASLHSVTRRKSSGAEQSPREEEKKKKKLTFKV